MTREKLEQVYLGVNGIAYLVLGAWCAIDPHRTSEMIGFQLDGAKGLAEYFAVYGGLEVGMGTFFLASLLRRDLRSAAIFFGVCLYGGIVLFRGISLALNGPTSGVGWMLYALEISCLVAGLLLVKGMPPSPEAQRRGETGLS
jgi:Domain of unknown function (DUF4345)